MIRLTGKQSILLLCCFLLAASLVYVGGASVSSQSEGTAVTLTPYAYLPLITLDLPPFVKTDASPFYLQNFANNAGCDWLGIAGEVLDLNHEPVPAGSYRVHIWGSGIDARVVVGTAPAYSPAGWEQILFDAPVVRDYKLQLELPSGTAVSPIYAVQTRASCNENLVRFDFIQTN
jgi:hypothetical protein